MVDADDRAESELLVAVGGGDDAAFAVIYRRYLPMVVRWCWRETGNRELAAEVFAAALTASRRYRADRGSIAAWLLGIARNKLRESRRRGRIEAAARRRLGVEPTAVTDADLERVEELASLDAEILGRVAGLPDDQRQAVLSRVVDERPYEEIAAELRCSEMAVRQRVSRGLNTLRSQTEEPS